MYDAFHFKVSQFYESDLSQCQPKTVIFQMHSLYIFERGCRLLQIMSN